MLRVFFDYNISKGKQYRRPKTERKMPARTVQISAYNHSDKSSAVIDPALVVPTGNAEPSSRLLNGSEDHGYAEEWLEPAVLPDGRECSRVYLFSAGDIVSDDGEPLEAEDYPFDDAHVVRIRVSD